MTESKPIAELPTVDISLWRIQRTGEAGGHSGSIYKRRWKGQNWLVIRSVGVESDGKIWAHLSVSRPYRCPTHEEMAEVKKDFLGDLPAISVWAPTDQNVNLHSYCLDVWCCLEGHSLPDFGKAGIIPW
jgi:hypothetical protein